MTISVRVALTAIVPTEVGEHTLRWVVSSVEEDSTFGAAYGTGWSITEATLDMISRLPALPVGEQYQISLPT